MATSQLPHSVAGVTLAGDLGRGALPERPLPERLSHEVEAQIVRRNEVRLAMIDAGDERGFDEITWRDVSLLLKELRATRSDAASTRAALVQRVKNAAAGERFASLVAEMTARGVTLKRAPGGWLAAEPLCNRQAHGTTPIEALEQLFNDGVVLDASTHVLLDEVRRAFTDVRQCEQLSVREWCELRDRAERRVLHSVRLTDIRSDLLLLAAAALRQIEQLDAELRVATEVDDG